MTNQKRLNKIFHVIRDGQYLDCEHALMTWRDDTSKKFLTKIRGETADADLNGRPEFLTCPYCEAPIRLRYQRSGGYPYFYHLHKSDAQNCIFEDKDKEYLRQEIVRARKYEGRLTGYLHTQTVARILALLEMDHECTVLGKPGRRLYHNDGSKQYRIPDIYFSLKGREIVIEVQNSPEWYMVIAERSRFYKENGIALIWVFTTNHLIKNTITSQDIAYRQQYNLFVFDKGCYEREVIDGRLILKCDYEEAVPRRVDGRYCPYTITKTAMINLSALTYPGDDAPFYVSYEKSLTEVRAYCDRRNEIEHEYTVTTPTMDRNYYHYILDAGYFATYGEFPPDIGVNTISRLNHLAHCYIACLYLYRALGPSQRSNVISAVDKKGTLDSKFGNAEKFWDALVHDLPLARAMFEKNQRMTVLTVRGWRKTIESPENRFNTLFPPLADLNQRALRLIDYIERVLK